MTPMCWVVTEKGIPRGVFLAWAEAARYKDRHGSAYWRIHKAPYYG